MNDHHQCQTPRSELAEQCRKHYEHLAEAAHEWTNTIRIAIDIWEGLPALINAVKCLENEIDTMDLPENVGIALDKLRTELANYTVFTIKKLVDIDNSFKG